MAAPLCDRLIGAALAAAPRASDVLFVPGRPVQALVDGGLIALTGPETPAALAADATQELARELMGLDGDPDGYRKSCWERIPGLYFTGDVASRDEDGYFWISGRADEVLNIAGHRVGTAEIEAALCGHRLVTEAAVIGVPDKIKGEVAKAFVVPAEGWRAAFPDEDALAADIRAHLRRELGPIVVLRAIETRDTLPRTQSGKILRRALRAVELGLPAPDVPVLEE